MSDERQNPSPNPAGGAPGPVASEDSGSQALSEALKSSFLIVRVVMAILVVGLLASGFFTVGAQQRAILLRFGKPVGTGKEALLGPGLHWAFPPPIDEHELIPYSEIQKVSSTIGWYYVPPGAPELPPGNSLNPAVDGYVITGDANIIHTRATLSYRVEDPVVYKFNFVDASNAVVNALNNALLYAAARFPVDGVLVSDIARFKETVQARVAELARRENLGIVIDQCDIQSVPPRQLRAKFTEVTTAESARVTAQNEALQYRNFRAKQAEAAGAARKSTATAESSRFASSVEAEARRFNDLLPSFRANPGLFVNYYLSEKLADSWTNADTFFLSERSTGEKRELRIQLSRELQPPKLTAPPQPQEQRISD